MQHTTTISCAFLTALLITITPSAMHGRSFYSGRSDDQRNTALVLPIAAIAVGGVTRIDPLAIAGFAGFAHAVSAPRHSLKFQSKLLYGLSAASAIGILHNPVFGALTIGSLCAAGYFGELAEY